MKDKKRGLNFIEKIFLFINTLLCAGLILSYFAPYINPQNFWLFAFFGLAYPPLLIGNLILMTYWLLRFKWPFMLSLVTIVIGWSVLNNNIGFRSASAFINKQGNAVRMMTYNVHNFKRYGEKNDLWTKHEILTLITEQHPDVIGFQEFYTQRKGEYNIIDSMVRIMGTNNYYMEPLMANSKEAIGMAIFSKFPIVARGMIRLATDKASGNQCLFIDVKKDEKIFRVYSVHLQSIKFDPKDYKYLDSVSHKGQTDMQSTKRLGGKLKLAFIKRSEQVFKVKAHAALCPYPYIISGDFNDTPTSFAVNEMAKGIKNAFREKGSGFGQTYNGDFPNYQIDYIMASPRFDVASYQIISKKLSDHYPLRSDLILN